MNIVFVSPEYPGLNNAGGLGSYVHNISEALHRRGHSVTVITPSIDGSAGQKQSGGVNIVAAVFSPYIAKPFLCNRRFLWRWQFDAPNIRRAFHESLEITRLLRAYLKEYHVDVLHFSEYGALGCRWALTQSHLPYVVRLSTPTRYVLEVNGFDVPFEMKLFNFMEMLPVRRCTGFYAPTGSMLAYVTRGMPNRAQLRKVIQSPVNTDRFSPSHHGLSLRNKVLLAGRVERGKGALLVAEVLPQLFSQNGEVTVTWVGADTSTAPGGGSMVKWIRSCLPSNYQHRFEWLGAVEFAAMPDIYRTNSLFWVPSVRDNLPNTGLEAMSSGLPVVASDRSGMEEVIIDGESGILFRSGDAQMLCQQTLSLLNDEERCHKLGKAARDFALSELSFDGCAVKVENLLQKAVALGARKP